MQSWQKILREQVNSSSFELGEDNDKYIVDGIISSYSKPLTAHPELLKEILDGAYKAGFLLARRRYSTHNAFVLIKSYKNAHMIIQFSVQPETYFVCELVYGTFGEELRTTAKKSKYFPHIYNNFDKTLPLDFMDCEINKEDLGIETHINVKDNYDWAEYFDYVYSFMVVMLEKLNTDESAEIFTITETVEQKQEDSKIDQLIKKLKEVNQSIVIQQKTGLKDAMIYIEWHEGYAEQSDDTKELLNTIIDDFNKSIEDDVNHVEIGRGRTRLSFVRTIFIKY